MDLVDEEHAALAGELMKLARFVDELAQLGDAARDRGDGDEARVRLLRGDRRERRLSGARRAPQDHRWQLTCIDRLPKDAALTDQVRLSDEFSEIARAHTCCEWLGGRHQPILTPDAPWLGLGCGDEPREPKGLQHRPQVTLLYAIGVGVLTNVALSFLGRVLRQLNVRFDPSGESVIIGVAAAVIVAAVGIGARRELIRLALLGFAVHASLVINRFLGVAISGRTPDDGSRDAFSFTPLALGLLAAGLILGIAIGLIARGFRPRLPWRPPDRLVRAAGFAFVVGAIAGVVWPGPFLAQLLGGADLVTAVGSLPLILAGPLAGGAYASRGGVDYPRG